MNTQATIAIVAIIALILGFGGGYYAKGTMTAQRELRGAFAQVGANAGRPSLPAGRFGANGQRPVTGTIDSISPDHMTIKSQDGSTHAVLIDNNTQYTKTTTANQADFAQGASVMVIGKQNPDGSITASTVQTAPERPTQSSTSPVGQ